jgi:hypothetical protein
MRAPAALLTFVAIPLLASSGLAGCGAKTGLLVPDVIRLPDVVDVVQDTGPEACVPGQFALARRSAEVLFAIDRSSSMRLTLDGMEVPQGDPRARWRVLRDALATALPPFQNQLEMGAVFFPQPVDDSADLMTACTGLNTLDLAPALDNATPIVRIFDATNPGGGTPTYGALVLASDYLQNAPRNFARYIVLATDGGPNCNFGLNPNTCACTSLDPTTNLPDCASANLPYNCLDESNTVRVIDQTYRNRNIPVYVIGIPDSTRPDLSVVLNHMADAGGRPRLPPGVAGDHFYSVRSPADLGTAFQGIQQTIVQCAFVTPSQPDDPDGITIYLDGSPLPHDPTQMNGWEWTDRGFGELTLFGAACARVVAEPNATLTARVGCHDGG